MPKCVLITDLDNTLFDWVDIWYQSFSSMFNAIVALTNIDQDQLKSEIRKVHQYHGTSEYAFLIEEVPALKAFAGDRPVTEVFSDAIDAYRIARRKALSLYPSVLKTLHHVKDSGCTIVGYTESMAFYTGYRIRNLALDGIIEIIFSPEDHDLPLNLTLENIRKYPAEHYRFKKTKNQHTPKGELKPNPRILHDIITSVGALTEHCVYVGDSLHKDIAMAKDAGVDHAWARYGRAQDRPEYQLLREVTHWTDQDVQREKEIHERNISPDHTLSNSFAEILDIYEFVRNFYISLITALVALIGVVITRTTDPFFAMGCYKLHVSVPFLISIVVATQLFYSIDRHWYHRLLVGAVKNAIEIEKKLIKDVPGIGLTTMIGDNSPLDVSAWTPGSRFLWITALLFGADKRVWKDGKIHSDAKISMFYKGVASVFAIMVIIVIISGGLAYTCENLPDKGAENTNAGPAQAK